MSQLNDCIFQNGLNFVNLTCQLVEMCNKIPITVSMAKLGSDKVHLFTGWCDIPRINPSYFVFGKKLTYVAMLKKAKIWLSNFKSGTPWFSKMMANFPPHLGTRKQVFSKNEMPWVYPWLYPYFLRGTLSETSVVMLVMVLRSSKYQSKYR